MKKILFLLLFTIASYGQAVFDEGIQITNNVQDLTAEKVNVQSTNGVLNWQFISDFQNNKPYFSTGLLKNGLLIINADNTKFDLSAGIGVYSDFSDPENVTSKVFNFPAFNAVVSPYLATSNITYVAVNYNGGSPVLVMQASPFLNTQVRDLVVVGAVIHSNFATINTINNISSPSNDVGNSVADLFNFLGARNQEGNVYSANGANLQLNKSAGVILKYGANFHVNAKNPHNVFLPEQLSLTFRYRLQGGFEGTDRINVDVDNYDLNNILTAVPPNKYTIQTIFIPQTGQTRIQYGQNTYNTLADAVAAINTRKFVTETNLAAQFVKVTYLVVKKGATSLQVVADADIIQASKFDATASGGVAITYQSIIDALTYVPENVANKVTSLSSPNNTTYPTTQLLKGQLDLKANDINVIHTTGNETKTGILTIDNVLNTTQQLSSNDFNIGQNVFSDWYKLYGYASVSDQTEMVFEVGDNGTPFSSGGQRFRFHYDASGSGVAKDPLLIDYNNITANTSFTSHNISINAGGSDYPEGQLKFNSTASGSYVGIGSELTGSATMFFDHRGESNTGMFVWRNGSGGSNTRMSLSGSGILSLNNLAGTGTRLVTADASGNLSAPDIPTAPTAVPGTNTTQIATTAFVLANSGATSGTYTPAPSGAANFYTCYWTKIGKIVTVTFNYIIVASGSGSYSTTLYLPAGLPEASPDGKVKGFGAYYLSSTKRGVFTVTSTSANTMETVQSGFLDAGDNIFSATVTYMTN